jgi:predicted dehydrogenase
MIESGNIQALIVSTPNDSHYPITMKALDAGLHVLCEKPLGLTYGEAQRMTELAEQKGVKHSVA